MNITIIGAGFAGIKAALELAKDATNSITVITDKPDFQYYPSLYSSATGQSHLESWVALGEIFADYDNVHVHIDKIIGIDNTKKVLYGAMDVEYPYSTLIIATGMVTTYFGIKGLDQYSYGIKSADQIRALKERLYRDLAEKGEVDKNYVVVGAGPTGVELAAALGTYLRKLCKYYNVKKSHVNVRLIEAAPRALPMAHENASKRVQARLEALGVEVQTGAAVEKQNAEALIVGGRPIATHTVIWTSGVTNNPLLVAHPDIFTFGKGNKVIVDEYMQAAKNIYVLGDNALTPYSGLAQTALRDGLFVAQHLRRKKEKLPLKPYKPVQPASAIPVGSNWAFFAYKNFRAYGMFGVLLRRAGDFHGWIEMLPFVQALRPWSASRIYEKDYFAPSPRVSRLKKR